jgi:hypothetical protein
VTVPLNSGAQNPGGQMGIELANRLGLLRWTPIVGQNWALDKV